MSYMSAEEPHCETKNCPEDVEMIITPRVVDLGGFEVRRALPNKKKCMVGPFVFWDQAGPGEFLPQTGIDVRPHPHIGLSTLTYLFEGSLSHRDSLGNHQVIVPGDVNLMTAGKGIAHSERTPQDVRTHKHPFFGIQCWLALPKNLEEVAPEFDHYSGKVLPLVDIKGMKARIVAGEYQGLKSSVKTMSDTLFIDCLLDSGAVLPISKEVEERALYILTGTIMIDRVPYSHGQLVLLKSGHDITISAVNNSHIIILGGAVLDGERYVWWNFVSSTKDRIEQAKVDWKNGMFQKIPGDDKEFIPLPD